MSPIRNALRATLLVLPVLSGPVSASEPSVPAAADPADDGRDDGRVDELERKVDILSEEIERMRLGSVGVPLGERYSGLGPAASKIFGAESGLSIGGYGELLLQDVRGTGDSADFLRAILYIGYRFDEHWVLNTEIEIEHADEIFLEFATLDYLHETSLNYRVGLVLIPMGFLNELHEPTTFFSARRPDVESFIIPSTWRENGVGIYGSTDCLDYRAYVVNGFDGEDFRGSSGLRGGRQKGSQAKADDFAGVVRVDYTGTEGLLVGGSAYYGDAGQENGVHGTVHILEAHAQYDVGGFRARALYATAGVDDVAALNEAGGLTTGGVINAGVANDASIGEELSGGYLEVGYDVLAGSNRTQSLTPFVRYEMYDLQEEVPAPFVANGSNDVDVVTFGVAWQPIPDLIFKLDFQDYDTGADNGVDRLNFGMGYIF